MGGRGLVLLLSFLFCFQSFGSGLEWEYKKGEEAFRNKDYEKAVYIFQNIADNTIPDASLLYDLGTSYSAAGNYGMGRLYLERAYKLDPRNKKIANNLDYVVSKVNDTNLASMTGKRGSVEPDSKGFIGDAHNTIARDHTSDYWALFAAMAFILALGSVALYLFPSNVAARKIGFFGTLLFLAFCGTFMLFSFLSVSEANNKEYGVITAYKYELLAEPDTKSAPSASPLNQGTKVRVVSEEADADGNVAWYKVRLNDRYLGWISADDLQLI